MNTIKKHLFRTACLFVAPLFLTNYASAETDRAPTLAELKSQYERPKEIPFPKDNPYSLLKVELGKTLFFDPRLSSSGTQSCATCHNPSFSWGDGMGLGTGDKHQKLGRKSPSILNLAWDHDAGAYMWDGRKESLEEQSLGPIEASVEMNMEMDKLIAFLNKNEGYQELFKETYPKSKKPISSENIAKSIATFERTVVSEIAPFDRWISGDESAISNNAKKGFTLFNGKANCASCHSSWRFSDASFHDIGLKSNDIGRGAHVPVESMQHAFKTVGLRNIAERGPYMHDGSLESLMAVIEHYDNGFVKRPSLSDEIKPLNLNKKEKLQLHAFLITLTSKDTPITLPILPN